MNPNIEETRTHNKAWAGRMGMLEPAHRKEAAEAWNEREFAALDYALLTSYTHPDAAPSELDLVTDWYVWAYFFDRHVVERYRRSSSLKEVTDYLVRLSAFMPIAPSIVSPAPANSVEFGLTDLWVRTMTSASADWRVRFAMNTQNLLEGSLWELSNIDQNHVPNPIEYVDMRRKVGRAPWIADLMEYVTSIEIPSSIAHTRSMRVLKNSFSDGVHLRSDIFSYQPDNDDERGINNCVHTVEKFFECNSQEAAELVNNLLTSRLYQFENSVLSELPLTFEEYGLDKASCAHVRRYTQGLQDWQSGDHEWHMRSIRHPSNLSRGRPLGEAVKIDTTEHPHRPQREQVRQFVHR